MQAPELQVDFGLEETIAQANAEAWARGTLGHLLLKGGQEIAYDKIQEWRDGNPGDSGPFTLWCHRGLGKTALLVLICIEEALSHAGAMARLGGPELKEIRGAAEPAIRMFLAQRPKEIEVDQTQDGYRIYNPRTMRPGQSSTLSLFGCRELGNNERGLRATLIALDEVRNLPEPEYVIDSVLRPMFARQARRFMLLSSTSPSTEAHGFWKYVDQAQPKGALAEIPFTENADFKDRPLKELESIFGPKDSVSWNREGLCKRTADESLLVLPSYTRNKARIRVVPPRPQYFYPYIFGDVGFIDAAAFLFAYVDHDRQKLVVEREIVRASLGSREMLKAIRELELELYGTCDHYDKIRRWADATPRELDDLRLGGLYFQAARKGDEKWDKWQGLARLESAFYSERIEIHPGCASLHYQLANAVKNKTHDDLERVILRERQDPTAPIIGHYDALWALAYGVWQIRNSWLTSPYPKLERDQGVYQSTQIEELRKEKQKPPAETKITSRPLVVTYHTEHIRGAQVERKRPNGRKVRF